MNAGSPVSKRAIKSGRLIAPAYGRHPAGMSLPAATRSRFRCMIVVAGEALVDLVIDTEGSVRARLGGGPYNVARTIGRLGHPVTFLGAISDDRFGNLLFAQLAADGVGSGATVRTTLPTKTNHFVMNEIPYLGEGCKAEVMSVNVTTLKGNPFGKFSIEKVVGASEVKNGALSFSYPKRIDK